MSKQPESVNCQSCGRLIGIYHQHDDHVWLLVYPLQLESAHGVCAACGAEWHWEASSQTLDHLIERRQVRVPVSVMLDDVDEFADEDLDECENNLD